MSYVGLSMFLLFSSPEPEAQGELIVWDSSRSVRPCVHTFKHEYLWDQLADHNHISSRATLGWGLTALGFGLDRVRTLVSMAADEGVGREVPNPHFPPPFTPLPSLSPPESAHASTRKPDCYMRYYTRFSCADPEVLSEGVHICYSDGVFLCGEKWSKIHVALKAGNHHKWRFAGGQMMAKHWMLAR